MRAWIFLGALALAVAIGACSCRSAPRPVPPVAPAPAELAKLRIHVVNATDHRTPEDEKNVTGYTMQVRGAVQRTFERAGYVVVVDKQAPHDVEAKVDTDYQTRTQGVGGTLVTSLILLAPNGAIDQFSATVTVNEEANIEEGDVARLIDAVGRSERLRRYADRLRRPDVPCLPAGPALAAPE